MLENIQKKVSLSGSEKIYLHETDVNGNRLYIESGDLVSYFITTAQDISTFDFEKYPTGYVFQTSGFYTKEDGGSATYIIEESLTANGIDIFALSDGRFAKYLLNKDNSANVLQFGAKGDDVTNNSTIFERAVEILIDGGELVFPKGVYRTDRALIVRYSNVTLSGYNATIKPLASFSNPLTTNGIISVKPDVSTDILYNNKVNGFVLDGADYIATPSVTQNGILAWHTYNAIISNNIVKGIENYGIWFSESTHGTIDGNTVYGAEESIEVAINVHKVLIINNRVVGQTGLTVNMYLNYANATEITYYNNYAEGSGNGLVLSQVDGGFKDISVDNFFCNTESGHGLIIEAGTLHSEENISISNSTFKTTGASSYGILKEGPNTIKNFTISNSKFYSQENICINLDGPALIENAKIINSYFEGKASNYFGDINDFKLDGNKFFNITSGYSSIRSGTNVKVSNNEFTRYPLFTGQPTIIESNTFFGPNDPLEIAQGSIVKDNIGFLTNVNIGINSIVHNNRFQNYFSNNNVGSIISETSIEWKWQHMFMSALYQVTGANTNDANTNAGVAGVALGGIYKWDDGGAIHLMIRK